MAARNLEIGLYLVGFMRATNRVIAGGDPMRSVNERIVAHYDDPFSVSHPRQDDVLPSRIYVAVFEACNWAVALDDRLRTEVAADWWKHVREGEPARGFRYVRNAVHHNWADAITMPEWSMDRTIKRSEVWRLRWRRDIRPGRPDKVGQRAFARYLAGESVGVTMAQLIAVYTSAVAPLQPRDSRGAALHPDHP